MLKSALAAAVLGLAVTSSAHAQNVSRTAQEPNSVAALRAKAERSGGKVRVIVEFGAPTAGAVVGGSAAATRDYSVALKSRQQDVIATHFADGASTLTGPDRSLTRMDFAPQFAINATAAEIQRLASDPRVVRLHEDKLARPSLRQSLPIMKMSGSGGAFSLPGGGAKGQGRAVAILDTGVLKTHEFLSGKVVSEACYNSTLPSRGSSSRCPGGALASTALGSAADCDASVADGCGHGTHVAGIAAGLNTGTGGASGNEPISGVAPKAMLLAINVFSKFDAQQCGVGAVSDCLLSYSSDQIKALERVFALRGGITVGGSVVKIDSVNMSLGGGEYTGFCNDNALKPIIDTLRTAGIATVIAAGNDGLTYGVSAPGCIQTAITVGASTKRASGFPELMALYTNMGPQVDLLAPGGDATYPAVSVGTSNAILSSIVSGAYDGYQGTSMAAPHVAGAIAAIRSRPACRNKTVKDIEYAIATTGPFIKDHRITPGFPQLRRRRIDVPAAMRQLGCFS